MQNTSANFRNIKFRPEEFQEILLDKIGFRTVEAITSDLSAQTLTDTLCKEIGKDDLTLNAKVLTLAYSHDGSSSSENWSITCTSNKKTQYDDAVIMTVWLHYSRGFTIQLIWQKEQNWRN
ncbi:hypothetical protein KIW84_070439 [Lathyrus oleraceus]|uniref:Uncharacterized protein n=1 Tax=Pisum sativum TaxID=3888 RepID=A0A9D4VI05_PEA|nr:hypothetical protein KIW84_070439 [Pisum sativum]